jgi:CubicO group peptidase (beta-lactamase class C family)
MKRLGQGLSVFLMLVCLQAGHLQSEAGLNQTAARTSSSSSARAASSVASPEEAGLSPERLGRVASSVQREIDNGRIAGAVTLVARHGKIAYLKAFGSGQRC